MKMNRPYEHRKAQNQRRELDLDICQLCASIKNVQAHHIFEYSKGGSAIVEGMITLCEDCHRMIHKDDRIRISKMENEITSSGVGGR
jgi:5-methylcytosine-specific restriction endonuclease McrA